jgi:hypothetical protein
MKQPVDRGPDAAEELNEEVQTCLWTVIPGRRTFLLQALVSSFYEIALFPVFVSIVAYFLLKEKYLEVIGNILEKGSLERVKVG